MESRASLVENLSVGISIIELVLLIVIAPTLILNFNYCTGPQGEGSLRESIFLSIVGVSFATMLGLYIKNVDLRSGRISLSIIAVFIGLVFAAIYYVFYFLGTACPA